MYLAAVIGQINHHGTNNIFLFLLRPRKKPQFKVFLIFKIFKKRATRLQTIVYNQVDDYSLQFIFSLTGLVYLSPCQLQQIH